MSVPVKPDFSHLRALADAADAVTLPLFRRAIAVENKKADIGAFDPVTEADREAERAMRAVISAHFPEHGIAGEEFEDLNPESSHVWHLDPIDGTRQFIAGVPLWGTMAGLSVQGSPVLGLVSQPFTKERFFGGAEGALHVREGVETPMRARACAGLSDAVMFTTSPHLFTGAKRDGYARLESAVKLFRYGIDCYAFVLLAAGFVDICIETGLDDHDIVPLVPIIEAAGGAVVDWQGNRATKGGDVLAVGDRRLLESAMRLIDA